MLGHSSLAITADIYGYVIEETAWEAMRSLGSMVSFGAYPQIAPPKYEGQSCFGKVRTDREPRTFGEFGSLNSVSELRRTPFSRLGDKGLWVQIPPVRRL